jgi:pectinesterase
MATPVYHLTRYRPLFMGLCASACGALCLATPACAGGADANEARRQDDEPNHAAGSGAGAGAPSQGGAAPTQAGSGPVTGGVASGAGAANAGGGGAASFGGGPALDGSPTRPQLPASAAGDFTVLAYLDRAGAAAAPASDGWDPTAGVGDVSAFEAKYRVASSGGSHTSVQAAIDRAVQDGGAERIFIEVVAGTYREVVCVPSAAPPITLFSKNSDARATRIVFDNYSGKTKAVGTPANPCNPSLDATSYGTSGSATFAAYAAGFRAKNLTFENDFDEAGLSSNLQAVALATQGDQQIYENVHLLGNQDTFFVKSTSADVISRVYVKSSFIQGDTDFIFGRAVLVIDDSEIHFISSRQGSKGYVIAPSTDSRNPHGILVYASRFSADEATTAGSVHLGRAWDESGKDVATYKTLVSSGVYPNGQALVRESTLGAHIRAADPWAPAATTSRAFSSVPVDGLPPNRLYELGNTGDGSAR